MKVLSLFDGMACGMLAMLGAGFEVERYVAYEIDKYAVQTSTHNFPMIEQKGDVFTADFTEYKGFDALVGGSPCTYWSIAQTHGRETEASGMGWELFSQYVRALREAEPKFFVYENNKSMSNAIRESITNTFGFEPICINSALVSAQNRQRLYWVGIRNEDGTYRKADIEQPEDRGILLKDILETNYQVLSDREMDYMMRDHLEHRWAHCNKPNEEDKSKCIVANVCKGVPYNLVAERVAEPINSTADGKASTVMAGYYKYGTATMITNKGFKGGANGVAERVIEPIRVGTMPSPDGTLKQGQAMRVYDVEGKSVTLKAQGGGAGAKTGLYAENVPECFRVKEATKLGYTDIKPGDCVDMQAVSSKTRRGRNMEEKCNCLQTTCDFYQYCGTLKQPIYEVKNGMITVKGKQYPIKLVDGYYIIRKLTVRECMRLQTVPEWYEFPVSNSQAYKMLGNGWTVEVIIHLLNGIK